MKSREWLFGFFSSLVTVPAVAHSAKLTPEVLKANRLRELPTLVRLKQRDDEILIKSDGGSLYYTVLDKEGAVTLENVSLEQIQAVNPELYDRLKVTVGDSYLDASNSR